jgi:MurNAc alpha-1-phosphate uridylyltransferase
LKAMILAAGRGERMMPLTRAMPKPLLQVAGKPLIEYHLEALADAGVSDVIINVHYFADQIMRALGNGDRWGLSISYSMEETLLETAGGIYQALELLGDEPFLVISADVKTHYDFAGLLQHDLVGLAHLVMVANPKHHQSGDFGLLDSGQLCLGANPNGQTYTWASIGVFSAAMFANLTPGRRKLRELFDIAAARGEITGEVFDGSWFDIGTPERLSDVNSLLEE